MYFEMNLKQFIPTTHFKQHHRRAQFITFANDLRNLHPFTDAMREMRQIDNRPVGYECAALRQLESPLGMFCAADSLESKLRMKLFCAFGMLNNFVNHSKIKLMVRGGMALRLQLDPSNELISTAPLTDIDGLIVVDRSIGTAELEQFKTTFMKLLVLSIKGSIDANEYKLICEPAGGDQKNTIKLKVTKFAANFELGDFGFKYSDDEIIRMYEKNVSFMTPNGMRAVPGIFQMAHTVYVYPGILQCVWNFPLIQNMKTEYRHVIGKLTKNIETIQKESPESRVFDAYSPFDDDAMNLRKLGRDLSKFENKSEIVAPYGGKKRTMKRRTQTQRRIRGGSTTEQIGAAAQMRAFLPRYSTIRNALNHIVHHESNNRFHDANYRHSPATQSAINKAFREINANPRVSRRTKKHMKIAKQKASTHRR